MGIPVDCENSGLVLNGEFDDDEHWNLDNLWQIHDGFADVEWLALTADINLYQFIAMTADEFYVIDFDVIEAICPGDSGLRVRLGGAAGNVSAVIRTTGHKRIVLQYNEQGEYLLFFIWVSSHNPGYIKIDNVISSRLQTFVACALGMASESDLVYGHLDLGAGIYQFKYAAGSDHTSVWIAFDINDL